MNKELINRIRDMLHVVTIFGFILSCFMVIDYINFNFDSDGATHWEIIGLAMSQLGILIKRN